MLMLLLRITIISLLILIRWVSGSPRLRGRENLDQRRRNQDDSTHSASGLGVLHHFGLDPADFENFTSGSEVFEPCDDVKTCLQWSAIVDEIDDGILQGGIHCTDVSDCAQGECRLTDQGTRCDVPGKLYCIFPCLEDTPVFTIAP